MAPDGQTAVYPLSHGRRRTERSVHVVGTIVAGRQRLSGVGWDLDGGNGVGYGRTPSSHYQRILRRLGQEVVKQFLLGRQAGFVLPDCAGLQRVSGGHGLFFSLGKHGQKTAVAHNFDDAGQVRYGRFIHGNQTGIVGRRAHNATVDHAGQAHIVDVTGLPLTFRGRSSWVAGWPTSRWVCGGLGRPSPVICRPNCWPPINCQ
jgi:hypothetical protein